MNSYPVFAKMTAREIVKNILQYLSMIIITMLAVTLFCGFISNAKTLEKAINDYKANSNLAEYTLQFSGAISQEDIDFFDSLDADYEKRIYVEGQLENENAKIYVGAGDITSPIITKGEKGVLIDKKVAERNEINIGDKIKISFMSLSYDFEVTGYMSFIEVANTYSVCPIYIYEDVLTETLGLPSTLIQGFYNQILVKEQGANVESQIKEHFSQKEDSNLLYIFDETSYEAVVSLESEKDQSLKMIYVFPVIFLLVSVLVILSTISQLILRERTNIGTLKAIGVPSRRILNHYATFGMVLCLIGGVLGVIFGPLIVTNVMQIKYNLVYSFPGITSVTYSLIWSLISLLIVVGLAGIIGLIIASGVVKTKPAECMRPMPPKENFVLNKVVESEKNKKHKNLLVKMAVRNIVIKPSRAFMTVIGIAGCVALLACSFGIGDTVNNSIDLELNKNYNYDVSSTYNAANEQGLLTALDQMIAENKVTAYETYKSFYMTASAKSIKDIFVYTYKPNSRFTKIDVSKGAVLSKSVAETIGAKEGDEVLLTLSGVSKIVEIKEIIETTYTNGLFLDTDQFDSLQHTNYIWIETDNPDDVRDAVNELNGTAMARTISDFKKQVNNTISSIDTIKITLMGFAIALSVVVLYNLSLLNIKERNREIATMKVLGFTSGEIGRTLLYEIMLLAFIGTALGLLLGFPILYLVMSINKVEVINFVYSLKPLSYVYSALISLLTALAINLLFLPAIRKINMTNSLKSVE